MAKYNKSQNGSFMHNCHMVSRKKESIFSSLPTQYGHDDIIAHLIGYAIIPLEEYYLLKGEKMPEEMLKKIKSANQQLNRNPEKRKK